MSIEDQDRRLMDLIAEALVPRGLRPQTDDEIEALLDAIGGEPLGEEVIKRILEKVKGKIPIGERKDLSIELGECALSERELELVALYRSQGKELPPDIQKKLEELRKKAKEEQGDEENGQQK